MKCPHVMLVAVIILTRNSESWSQGVQGTAGGSGSSQSAQGGARGQPSASGVRPSGQPNGAAAMQSQQQIQQELDGQQQGAPQLGGQQQQQGGQQQGGQGGQQNQNDSSVSGPLPYAVTHRSTANFHGITRRPFFEESGVRQQLNLSDDQFAQLRKAHFQAFQRLREGVSGLDQNLSEDDRKQQMQMLETIFDQEFRKSTDGIINDPQLRARFDQLNRQYQGLNAFKDPAIRKQFNLTPVQYRQLTSLTNRWRQQMQSSQRGDNEDTTVMQFHRGVQRTDFMNELNSILKPEQRNIWTQFTGQAYDFQSQTFFPQSDLAADSDSGQQNVGLGSPVQNASSSGQSTQQQGGQTQGAQPQSAQPQGNQSQGAQPHGAQPQAQP